MNLTDSFKSRIDNLFNNQSFKSKVYELLIKDQDYNPEYPIEFKKIENKWEVTNKSLSMFCVNYLDSETNNLTVFTKNIGNALYSTIKDMKVEKLELSVKNNDCIFEVVNDNFSFSYYVVVPISMAPLFICILFDTYKDVSSKIKEKRSLKC